MTLYLMILTLFEFCGLNSTAELQRVPGFIVYPDLHDT